MKTFKRQYLSCKLYHCVYFIILFNEKKNFCIYSAYHIRQQFSNAQAPFFTRSGDAQPTVFPQMV